MLSLRESNRNNPRTLECECGRYPQAVLHQDGLEINCECKRTYFIEMPNVWNCCSIPVNK